MEIRVFRVRFHETRTVGQLYVNGDFFCFTLEDKVREIPNKPVADWKVQNETAIPEGKYRVVLQNSPKFGEETITLLRVPGFTNIRIHSGNMEDHTDGCLILGYRLNNDGTIKFGTTRPAVRDLKARIRQAIYGGQKVYIEIKNIR